MLSIWQEDRIPEEISLANSCFAVVIFDIKVISAYDVINVKVNRNCLNSDKNFP